MEATMECTAAERKYALKLRRLAEQATFTTHFVKKCLALDGTQPVWAFDIYCEETWNGKEFLKVERVANLAGKETMKKWKIAIWERWTFKSDPFPFGKDVAYLTRDPYAMCGDGTIGLTVCKANGYHKATFALINDYTFIRTR